MSCCWRSGSALGAAFDAPLDSKLIFVASVSMCCEHGCEQCRCRSWQEVLLFYCKALVAGGIGARRGILYTWLHPNVSPALWRRQSLFLGRRLGRLPRADTLRVASFSAASWPIRGSATPMCATVRAVTVGILGICLLLPLVCMLQLLHPIPITDSLPSFGCACQVTGHVICLPKQRAQSWYLI